VFPWLISSGTALEGAAVAVVEDPSSATAFVEVDFRSSFVVLFTVVVELALIAVGP
jgi:hypothetical protein